MNLEELARQMATHAGDISENQLRQTAVYQAQRTECHAAAQAVKCALQGAEPLFMLYEEQRNLLEGLLLDELYQQAWRDCVAVLKHLQIL